MNKIKIILGLFILSLMVVTTSCSSSSSPGETVKEFSYAMEKGDYDKLTDAIYTNGEEMTEKDKEKFKALFAMGKEQIDKKEGLKDIEIIEETISEDGNSAIVKTKTIYGDGSDSKGSTNLILVDGDWKFEIKQ